MLSLRQVWPLITGEFCRNNPLDYNCLDEDADFKFKFVQYNNNHKALHSLMPSPIPWQLPNATEAHAAQQLGAQAPIDLGHYIAYPWATWIDRSRRGLIPPALPALSLARYQKPPLATVCQHIWALDYLELFQKAGITDLFWSHATKGCTHFNGLRIHPFPLYAVRCASHPRTKEPIVPWKRDLLYSFQGAYAPGLYLTQVREWIFQFPQRADAVVDRREEWHYEQQIYREQVLGGPADDVCHTRIQAEADDYVETLRHSCFVLCPSGSGPNSIRIWEALGYGAIPVILADSLQLPGDAKLWQQAAVFVRETENSVKTLPQLLEQMATDLKRLESMQAAGRQLWHRYGLNGFVHDVVNFLHQPGAILLESAKHRLPGKYHILSAVNPTDLPLRVRRWHRVANPTDSLLIVIQDSDPIALTEVRWKIALSLCQQILSGRCWSISSLNPKLEQIGYL